MEREEYSEEITDQFLNRYRELENIKNQSPERYEHFYDRYRSSLDAFRSLRNCLSHYQNQKSYPAIVSKSTLDEIEKIIRLMSKKASDVYIPSSRITFADTTESISSVIEKMHESQFSLLPIVDERKKLIGVVSDRAMIDLIALHKESLKERKISDYLDYFSTDGNSNEYYAYIARDAFAYEAKNIFSLRNGKRRCKALFVTEHGLKTETVIGLITALDVIEL